MPAAGHTLLLAPCCRLSAGCCRAAAGCRTGNLRRACSSSSTSNYLCFVQPKSKKKQPVSMVLRTAKKQKEAFSVGIEPTTTRLRVVRSTS